MSTRVEIYDTTLRDGTQGESINFSVADKIRIAEALDELGVDYIEGGWPGSNPRDVAFFDEVRAQIINQDFLRKACRVIVHLRGIAEPAVEARL